MGTFVPETFNVEVVVLVDMHHAGNVVRERTFNQALIDDVVDAVVFRVGALMEVAADKGQNAAALFHGIDDFSGVLHEEGMRDVLRLFVPGVDELVAEDDDRFLAGCEFFAEPFHFHLRNDGYLPVELAERIVLAFVVIEAGVEDDVLHAVLHEGIVGFAVGIARIVRVGEIVAERNLVEVMVAHDVVAVALITAEGRFDRLQEADGQFAVNRLRAVLKVAEFNGEIKLARIEDVNGLMEFGKGMRINADGVFRRDRVGAVV